MRQIVIPRSRQLNAMVLIKVWQHSFSVLKLPLNFELAGVVTRQGELNLTELSDFILTLK